MYSLLIETLLGINLVGNELHLSPKLPEKWDKYTVHYRYKGSIYHIIFSRISDSSLPSLSLDGQILEIENILPLIDDGQEHFVEMNLVRSKTADGML